MTPLYPRIQEVIFSKLNANLINVGTPRLDQGLLRQKSNEHMDPKIGDSDALVSTHPRGHLLQTQHKFDQRWDPFFGTWTPICVPLDPLCV